MSLAPGRTLSHYRLIAPLGEGGMGVVWRANDSTLGRDVAIKVLPDLFASDPERLARFEREAKVLASLNDPHVASIYGLHSADGVRFLAMELVDGEDLAKRIERGPIPLAEVLPIALQIAQALEHAHEKGVVHRDLKPANVVLTPEAKIKVLDFGLAKALEGEPGRSAASSSAMSQSPTLTGAMTGVNVLLGTAAYMAPEQARGHVADKRADIWAFGVLVMEMLTGRGLFEGETISDTLASVLKTDPEWSALPAETPSRLRTMLRRCLERNPKQRLRDIGEARIALEEIIAGKTETAAVSPPAATGGGIPWWMAATAGIALGGLAMFGVFRMARPPEAHAPLRKFHLTIPPAEGATPVSPAISPDGRTVAYVASGSIWLQSLGDLEPREIKVNRDPTHLFWSPDGKYLGYVSGSQILKSSLDGSENQVICDVRGEMTGGAGASWGPDGMIAFSRGDSGGIYQVPAVGGDPKPLVKPDSTESDLHEPSILPAGRGLLFLGHRIRGGFNNIAVWSRGRRKTILDLPDQTLGTPVFDPSGYILFSRTPTTPGVWALPFSLSRLAATGQPFLVAAGGSAVTVSRDGTLALLSGAAQGARQLVWWDREGKELGTVGNAAAQLGTPAISPDGKRIASPASEGSNRDIWIWDTARGTRTRLTFDPGNEDFPAWSPDGERIVYHVLASGASPPLGFRIVVRAADGTGGLDTLVSGVAPHFTPDGSHVIYTDVVSNTTLWSISEVPLQASRTPRQLIKGNPRALEGVVSPSRQLLAYMSSESGQWEIYLTKYPSCEGRWQVSTAGGQWPHWNALGDRLFFSQGEDVLEVEVGGAGSPVLGTPKRLFTRPTLGTGGFGFYAPFEVSGDGTRFLGLRAAGHQGPAPGVTVVQNWTAEFPNKK
jgi:Tol biopolymer transport system component